MKGVMREIGCDGMVLTKNRNIMDSVILFIAISLDRSMDFLVIQECIVFFGVCGSEKEIVCLITFLACLSFAGFPGLRRETNNIG